MIDVESYLELGYTGIAILDSEWHEDQSGYQPETTTEHVVCLGPGGQPLRLEVVWFEKFFPKPSTSHRIEKSERMSRAEYENTVASRGGVLDTPERSTRIEQQREKRVAAQERLARLRPTCPDCQQPMTIRSTRSGDRRFWGCRRYPTCKGTRSMTTDAAAEIARLLKAGAML